MFNNIFLRNPVLSIFVIANSFAVGLTLYCVVWTVQTISWSSSIHLFALVICTLYTSHMSQTFPEISEIKDGASHICQVSSLLLYNRCWDSCLHFLAFSCFLICWKQFGFGSYWSKLTDSKEMLDGGYGENLSFFICMNLEEGRLGVLRLRCLTGLITNLVATEPKQ